MPLPEEVDSDSVASLTQAGNSHGIVNDFTSHCGGAVYFFSRRAGLKVRVESCRSAASEERDMFSIVPKISIVPIFPNRQMESGLCASRVNSAFLQRFLRAIETFNSDVPEICFD